MTVHCQQQWEDQGWHDTDWANRLDALNLYQSKTYQPRENPNKPFSCPVEGCNRNYYHRHHLKRHLIQTHGLSIESLSLAALEAPASCPMKRVMGKTNNQNLDRLVDRPRSISIDEQSEGDNKLEDDTDGCPIDKNGQVHPRDDRTRIQGTDLSQADQDSD